MRFEGTSAYVATDDLKVAVNAAITLERPLLVKGEPGTGKTVLALEIAKSLGASLLEWHVKSTTKALQGLYEYDAVSRLRDSQLGDERVHRRRRTRMHGERVPGREQVPCHRRAHHAEPDEADAFGHAARRRRDRRSRGPRR